MTIEKAKVFRLVNSQNARITSKSNKPEITDGTGETTCEVVFKTLSDKRIVPLETTGLVVCLIQKWINTYNNKVIPNSNDERRSKAEAYIQKWEYRLESIIPENAPLPMSLLTETSDQYWVNKNKALLGDNKLLSYNQALFLLLGLNAIELDHSLAEFVDLSGTRPNNIGVIETELWNSSQNQELKTSVYVKDGKIKSEDLIQFGIDNNFFVNLGRKKGKAAKPRLATIEKQKIIDKLAKEITSQHSKGNKKSLSYDIEDRLKREYEIEMSNSTIYRDYLDKYPNF